MSIQFQRQDEVFTFFDQEGNQIERKTEVRYDPITNETSRIIFNPGFKGEIPDYSQMAAETSGSKCPFCSENILKMTPVFAKNLSENGRFTQGESILFPNLFPYSKHNGVAVICKEHYVQLDEFTPKMIQDAFMNANHYVQAVRKVDKNAKYASINWNYLPESGGSILHPHLHIIVNDAPTNTTSMIESKLKENPFIFNHLYESEKENKERFIGEIGEIAWLSAYSPKSHHDYIGIFHQGKALSELAETDFENFAHSLTCIFQTLTQEGFASFNLSLQIPLHDEAPVYVRLMPRFTIGMLKTSDMNFFQMMHNEPLSYFSPEEVAEKAKKYFK